MKTLYKVGLCLLQIGMLLVVSACTTPVEHPQAVNNFPKIYPDYVGVTIPVGIAPLDFNFAGGSFELMDVVAKGSKGGELHVQGDFADFDIDEWHELTETNKGGKILVTVSVMQQGQWRQYKEFPIYVSPFKLDAWGLTYRRIAPGYEIGGDIGIYQRNLSNFDEEPILTETDVPGRCMNCHTSNQTDPKEFTAQIRGENGGTLISIDGHSQWVNTKTDSTKAAGSYASWHPNGRYVAYATNSVHQSFFTGRSSNLEVYHKFSDIILLDTKTWQLVLAPQLQTSDWLEIFPAFSADGKTLYYSTSKACNVPAEYLKVKCSLVSIPFDAATGTFGSKVDTLLNGPKDNRSYVLARPSYDGRWLMYTVASRSNFPIAQRDADLWMMDLKTHMTRPLTEVNSPQSESYHNWSADSHWFVFSSKRGDGSYTKLYIASVDNQGRVSKPFLLPQRNPWEYYHNLFDAYNVPDFTKNRVDFDAHQAHRDVFNSERRQVTIRP